MTTATKVKPTVLKVVASSSRPNVKYEIRLGGDQNVYCTCPAWRFQAGVSPQHRTCKHIKAFALELAVR